MLACRSLLQCPQQGGAGLSCLRYTCLVFTVRFLESSSRTPSTSARSHQRASRGEGPCACSLYYFLKCHKVPSTAFSKIPSAARDHYHYDSLEAPSRDCMDPTCPVVER